MTDGLADPLPLAQALLRRRSITPADDGAQAVLAAALAAAGFAVTRLRAGNIENLYAERGAGGRLVCFAGHTDVVPPGAAWQHDPFAGVVEDGLLYGRGAVDMKGAIAAFVAAAAAAPDHLRVGMLVTGDEEGEAVNGTVKILDWLRAAGKKPDFCIVGEPTCRAKLGDMMKIGRRGSLNADITVTGRQGHAAYPQLADNPIHRLVAALDSLAAHRLDAGTQWFEPSSLQITSIDVGNAARNVIPARAGARLNIRFNDQHDEASLAAWLRETVAGFAPAAEVQINCSAAAFLTKPGEGTGILARAITEVTGLVPESGTGGGTSDARFIAPLCPVAEFGLVGRLMHQTDECVAIADLRALARIYAAALAGFAG